jgi:hypothetical protein
MFVRIRGESSKSKSKSCYDRWLVGQSVLVPSSYLGPNTRFLLLSAVEDLLMWDALSYDMMGLSLTIVAGPRQRSHSRVRVLRDSWPYFTVSDLRIPQPGGPGPRIYSPQEQSGQLYTQAVASLFFASYEMQATVDVFEPVPIMQKMVLASPSSVWSRQFTLSPKTAAKTRLKGDHLLVIQNKYFSQFCWYPCIS